MLTRRQGDKFRCSHRLTIGIFNRDRDQSRRDSRIHESKSRIDVRETGPESIGSLLLTNSCNNKSAQIRAAGGNADARKQASGLAMAKFKKARDADGAARREF